MSRLLFEYALLRVLPSLPRGECLNVGVLVHCQQRDLLQLGVHLDRTRLMTLAPGLDLAELQVALAALQASAAGQGPAGTLSTGQRFRWLTAPRSTLVQAGPAHTGLTSDPDGETERLLAALVR